jgi:hypothetical protein
MWTIAGGCVAAALGCAAGRDAVTPPVAQAVNKKIITSSGSKHEKRGDCVYFFINIYL